MKLRARPTPHLEARAENAWGSRNGRGMRAMETARLPSAPCAPCMLPRAACSGPHFRAAGSACGLLHAACCRRACARLRHRDEYAHFLISDSYHIFIFDRKLLHLGCTVFSRSIRRLQLCAHETLTPLSPFSSHFSSSPMLHIWGRALAPSSAAASAHPSAAPQPLPAGARAAAVACGTAHTLVACSDGRVFAQAINNNAHSH